MTTHTLRTNLPVLCHPTKFPVPSRFARRMEDAMRNIARLVPAGLVLLLSVTPIWGQTPVCKGGTSMEFLNGGHQ